MSHAKESTPASGNCSQCICDGKGPVITQMLKMMLPSETAGEHFRTAGVEFLKGFRDLLDHKIEAMSAKQTKGTKFSVD